MTTSATLPLSLYTAAQSRELDRIAIEERGIPGIILMKRAGRAAWQALTGRWPRPEAVTVFCGGGNNGGDGYIVAALAAQQNVPVQILHLADPARLQGDAARARDFAAEAGVVMRAFAPDVMPNYGIVVDAMLGTGSRGVPRDDYALAIDLINASKLPVVALDLPSGLEADSGHVPGACVRAALTITFIALKRGLLTGRAPAFTGTLIYDSLQLPANVFDAVPTRVRQIPEDLLNTCLSPRPADAHKGHFGHVLVVGGELGTGGAALLAAEAAGRCGAGLISVATRAENVAGMIARRPELMVRAVADGNDLDDLMQRASVVVVGPGLGRSDWSRQLWNAVLKSDLPIVVDADALNLISEASDRYADRSNWVLTPHPGEAARLLACSTGEIQADRFGAAASLQSRFGGAVVLKGAGSLIATEGGDAPDIAVCKAGNPGMASGGMGDVLSGVIGALLAQSLPLAKAAELGVLLHAQAADLAAQQHGMRGLLASDLLVPLQRLVNSGGK